MIKLTKATVFKYKSIQKAQTVEIDPSVTTIVGMNEAGKTSFLEALAKTNYFNTSDKDFKYDTVQDYPRSEYVDFQNGKNKQEIISCEYLISDELLNLIETDLGKDVFKTKSFKYICSYNSETNTLDGVSADQRKFIEFKLTNCKLSPETKAELDKVQTLKEIATIVEKEGDEGLSPLKAEINKMIEDGYKWPNPLEGYIAFKYLKPKMPKFWYFDNYYDLPGKININELSYDKPESERDKTSKALFELAGIKPADVLNSQEYERFIALLEASSIKITKEIFNYWSTNQNLDIEFKIQDVRPKHDPSQIQKHLDIRVKSQRHKISLPLDRRSKGFNWFFSFIVWFNKIQGDKNSNYILLLDEPGLNLHAAAQADLMRFIEKLSEKYQIIYTTHSPFMVDSTKLSRVRTCLETEEGTVISETIKEKDSKTLFPLQAALGYDIAQNLFISRNNLLVEGPADLIYLTALSGILESEKRTGLSENITIVPVGGLDKVATFISLLKGSKLNIACLLDTFLDQKGKQRVEDLIKNKIIKEKSIRFFHEFSNNSKSVADIEDVFDKDDYLKIFNAAFESKITAAELDTNIDTIVQQLNKAIGQERYNHYRPALKLNQLGVNASFFSAKTLDNFEKMFKEINKVMGLSGEKVEVSPTFN